MKTRILILLFVTAGGAAIWFGTGWFPSIPTADEPSTSTDSDADDESEFELDPVKQQQIWDDEHATFEIEHRLGKLLKDAFRSQDRRILGSLLKEDFQAAVPNPEGAPQASVAGVTESHWEHTDGPSIPTDAKQFVGYLIGEREQFGTVSSRTLRVLRIEETEPDQWSTELFFVAAGTGADGGLRELTLIQNVRMSFASDEDLDSKPVIEEWSVTSRRARTAEKTGFREITQDVGLDQVPIPDNWELPNKDVLQYRFQYAVEDYDGDGHLDIAVAEKANSYLYRWSPEKKQFEDVTKAAGIRPVHELYGKAIDLAGFIDFDNDGLPDLLLGNRL